MLPRSTRRCVAPAPNFVKTAPAVAAMRRRLPKAAHVLAHTCQHYDYEMSELFLKRLGMLRPDRFRSG